MLFRSVLVPPLPQALLRFVCEMAQQLSGPKQAGRVALPFYAVVLCEALAAMKAVSTAMHMHCLAVVAEPSSRTEGVTMHGSSASPATQQCLNP